MTLPTSLLRRAGALAAVLAACAAAAPAAGAATPQIDAGDNALCAVADGRVTCHGLDASSVAHVDDFTKVAVGLQHACGLRAGGAVACWPGGSAPASPPAGTFASLGAGWSATCALTPAGAPACWGEDPGYGVLDAPQNAGPLNGLSVGEFHSCALKASDEAVCWGANVSGQADPEPGAFTAVSAGGGHTCGLRPAGTVDCWGLDNSGQAQDQAPPAGQSFVAVDAGSTSTCALTGAGEAVCWGSNDEGETDVPAGTYSAVAVGRGYACAVRTSGALVCWGDAPVPDHEYAVAFHAPVDAAPAVNTGRAGRVVPVKVEVFDRGEEVRTGDLTLVAVPSSGCGDAAPASGGAPLTWDPAADRWQGRLDTSGLGTGCSRVEVRAGGDVAGWFVLRLR